MERVLPAELVFTYNPQRRGLGQVIDLIEAERHVITGRGISHLGIDPQHQLAPRVVPHSLDVSSVEMDYLAVR